LQVRQIVHVPVWLSSLKKTADAGPRTPEGVEVYTPAANLVGFSIDLPNLPFFQFQSLLQAKSE
jgi:hypothetical protein